MTWILRAGLRLARRDADTLQLGVDPPRVAVLPDSPRIRTLLTELAHGAPLSPLRPESARALEALVRSDLVVAADQESAAESRRSECAVHLDGPGRLLVPAGALITQAGLRLAGDRDPASVALIWAESEVARGRVDGWMRSGTPHLVVREGVDGPVLGPYVVPGATACLRCVDAHAAEADPRRALVVEQVATRPPLRPAAPDPVLRALALAWAVRDLATAAEGGVPATWSATVALGGLPPVRTTYRRHVHCGCSWADELTSGEAARAG